MITLHGWFDADGEEEILDDPLTCASNVTIETEIVDMAEEEIDEDLIEEVGGIDKVFTMGASWIMEVVLVPCPEEFANYVVDQNIFKEHKFFADIFGNFNCN